VRHTERRHYKGNGHEKLLNAASYHGRIISQAARQRSVRGNSPSLAIHDGQLWAARRTRLWLTTLTNRAASHSIKAAAVEGFGCSYGYSQKQNLHQQMRA
jgi:hypothetical protein